MKTLDMMIEAKETGNTYKTGDMAYSHEMGFVDSYSLDPWEGEAFESLNDLLEISDWKKKI